MGKKSVHSPTAWLPLINGIPLINGQSWRALGLNPSQDLGWDTLGWFPAGHRNDFQHLEIPEPHGWGISAEFPEFSGKETGLSQHCHREFVNSQIFGAKRIFLDNSTRFQIPHEEPQPGFRMHQNPEFSTPTHPGALVGAKFGSQEWRLALGFFWNSAFCGCKTKLFLPNHFWGEKRCILRARLLQWFAGFVLGGFAQSQGWFWISVPKTHWL